MYVSAESYINAFISYTYAWTNERQTSIVFYKFNGDFQLN